MWCAKGYVHGRETQAAPSLSTASAMRPVKATRLKRYREGLAHVDGSAPPVLGDVIESDEQSGEEQHCRDVRWQRCTGACT